MGLADCMSGPVKSWATSNVAVPLQSRRNLVIHGCSLLNHSGAVGRTHLNARRVLWGQLKSLPRGHGVETPHNKSWRSRNMHRRGVSDDVFVRGAADAGKQISLSLATEPADAIKSGENQARRACLSDKPRRRSLLLAPALLGGLCLCPLPLAPVSLAEVEAQLLDSSAASDAAAGSSRGGGGAETPKDLGSTPPARTGAEEQRGKKRAEEDKTVRVLRRFSTPGGVRVEEVVVGSGDMEAQPGDTVTFHYVLRRSNGYFVASTVDPLGKMFDPVQLPLGPQGQMIQGLSEVIQGMRAGGKRRAVVPPEVGYVTADLQPLPQEYDRQRALFAHAREPLLFEVLLLKVKRGGS